MPPSAVKATPRIFCHAPYLSLMTHVYTVDQRVSYHSTACIGIACETLAEHELVLSMQPYKCLCMSIILAMSESQSDLNPKSNQYVCSSLLFCAAGLECVQKTKPCSLVKTELQSSCCSPMKAESPAAMPKSKLALRLACPGENGACDLTP